MVEKRQKIVSDAGFIDSIREVGITTTEAINEFIDNSFDANAKNIWITIEKDDRGRLFLIVEDDGDGIQPDQLNKVLAFGGRIQTPKITTGKFGWGLTASACCQSPRTEIFSKVKGKDFYYCYIDLEELKKNGGWLPDTIKKDPFEEDFAKYIHLNKGSESGTIIILRHLDRPERAKVDTLARIVKENIATVQRYFLYEGKQVFVNDEPVKYNDPLMLMDKSENVEKLKEKAEVYGKIEPIIYKHIKDHEGNPAQIEIKIVILPIKSLLELSQKKRGNYPFNVNPDNQGFYIIRNKRQIAGGQTLHLFTRHPQLNYFRGEMSFSPILDEKFGIQTNKSRFSLSDDLRKKLEERVNKIIAQIRDDIKNKSEKIRLKQQKLEERTEPTPSEIIATKASKRLKRRKLTKEEIEKTEKELEEEKQKKIEEIKKDKRIPEDKKKELIRKIEIAFQKQAEFKRTIDIIGTGEFYTVKHKGKIIEVVINSAHGFYKKIYERATQDPMMQILLDLFLFTLAKAEDIHYDNEEVRKFYNIQRREWSSIMSAFLEEAEEELEDELSRDKE